MWLQILIITVSYFLVLFFGLIFLILFFDLIFVCRAHFGLLESVSRRISPISSFTDSLRARPKVGLRWCGNSSTALLISLLARGLFAQ